MSLYNCTATNRVCVWLYTHVLLRQAYLFSYPVDSSQCEGTRGDLALHRRTQTPYIPPEGTRILFVK